jgi:hypothetical protein
MPSERNDVLIGESQRRNWAESEAELLSTQRAGLKIVLRSCADVISRNLTSDVYADKDPRTVWIPHEVLCIDGGRGSGKTFTLSSLPHALDALSNRYLTEAGDLDKKYLSWKTLLCEVIDDVSLKKGIEEYEKSSRHKGPPLELAHVLRIIFPGDMEGGESVMEAFFAALLQEIQEIEKSSRDGKPEYEELKTELRGVAEGFYFAKRFGVDAIIRDSVDYEDLVTQFEAQSNKSSYRTRAWRKFVYHYLTVRKFPVLVILLDDSDVEADLTRDILHAIRMFLCHPRIITVLAGNTRSMRDSLVHHGMRRLGASVPALDRGNRRTAQDWRQAMRKDAEYYLEKVLPQERRVFIGPPELSFTAAAQATQNAGDAVESGNETVAAQSDFKKVAQSDFSSIIRERIDAAREPFLRSKFHLAIEYENDKSDAPDQAQRRDIEDFLAWWTFANRYAGPLAPRSARQIRTFRTYYVGTGQKTKRLPVMLHDIPENYTLIQRLSDEDFSLMPWLWQQELRSEWTGQRCFRINGRAVYQGTYTFDFIRYRLDLNLAMPMRKNSEESVPAGLLPTLRGRRYMRRFFQPLNMPRQQRRVGLVRWIDHAALPGNCFYFCDLATLPDLSLVPSEHDAGRDAARRKAVADSLDDELSRGKWEAGLAGRWMELLAEEQQERLIRYLTGVTFERLRGTEGIESTRLISILDQEGNYYEDFLNAEIASFEWPSEVWDRAKNSLGAQLVNQLPAVTAEGELDEEGMFRDKAAATIIARHAALISDLRRAWHAIRIHESAPASPMESGNTAGALQEQERTSNEVIANQGRMTLYSRSDLKRLFDRSPWTADLLLRLGRKNLEVGTTIERLNTAIAEECSAAEIPPVVVQKLFSFDEKETKSDVASEKKDYQQWSVILRAVGRAACTEWRVQDKFDYGLITRLEDGLLQGVKLDVSFNHARPPENLGQQQNGRDARNFVLLLYGLAPSFSAIIHSQMMAQLLNSKFRNHDRNTIVNSMNRELEEWIAFIGALSVSLRYIKIKCMHLFAKLFINNMFRELDEAVKRSTKRNGSRPKARKEKTGEQLVEEIRRACIQATEFLRQCGITLEAGQPGEQLRLPNSIQELEAVVRAVGKLRDLFGKDVADNLAIMPDVAPSTLFGDKWMVELIWHQGIRCAVIQAMGDASARKCLSIKITDEIKTDAEDEDAEDPLNVRGIFSETEQWLWATNRCLRKWHDVMKGFDPEKSWPKAKATPT